MTIEPGSHIGPYQVVSQLGEGGMGVVFRGRDARLQRDVALKLLPEHFAGDPERLSRFQREAQLLASLNHPNIAQIYGLEQVADSVCLVMELVEGQTLEERLKTGPMPFSEVQDVAKQMADALAAAHERGIVHRDLKPANVKLTPSGVVKVLDFGLAKAVSQQSSDLNASTLPTMASGSITGAIVGTPGYMSPEQARGKEVDARTDIWAFGCVLYEMLTGRQAFGGETLMDVMAKVVTATPDLELLPKDTPSALRMLLSATLNKSVPQRLQHIGDTRLFLDPGLLPVQAASEALRPPQSRRGKFVVAILALALVIVAVPAFLYFRSSPQAAQKMVFEVSFPNLVNNAAAISPAGDAFAYMAQPPDGKRTLWIRPLNSETAVQLSGTDDISGFTWLPGGQALVFISDGKLRRIDTTGGSVRVIAEVGSGFRGLTASRNGVILGARISDNIIVQISESGEVKPITSLDSSSKELFQALPVFLPDGNRFLYISVSGETAKMGLYVASLDAPTSATQVLSFVPNNLNNMYYVPSGHLLMLQAGKLTATPMDASGRVEGEEAVTLAEGLTGTVSVSDNGMLLYRKAGPQSGMKLTWFGRDGKQSEQVGETASYGGVELSAQGDRAAVDIVAANNSDIWVMDLSRGVPTRITHDRARDWSPSFSPDGRQLVFASAGRDAVALITQSYTKSSSGLGQEAMVPGNEESSIVVDWSSDGKTLVLSRSSNPNGTQPYDTWIQPVTGGKPTPYLQTPFDKIHGQVSPDGKWLAYSTNESGTYQIVVQSFPDPTGAKSTVTAEGGVEPKWRRDGHELYYLAFDGKMMAVPVMGGATFEVGRPVELFQTPLSVNRTQPVRVRRYDVAPDGRFLMVIPEGERAQVPLTFVVNWQLGLKP